MNKNIKKCILVWNLIFLNSINACCREKIEKFINKINKINKFFTIQEKFELNINQYKKKSIDPLNKKLSLLAIPHVEEEWVCFRKNKFKLCEYQKKYTLKFIKEKKTNYLEELNSIKRQYDVILKKIKELDWIIKQYQEGKCVYSDIDKLFEVENNDIPVGFYLNKKSLLEFNKDFCINYFNWLINQIKIVKDAKKELKHL